MALAHVVTASMSPGSPGGTTAAVDTTGADLLVWSVGWYAAGGALSVSDSKGNVWVPLTQRGPADFATHRFWYAKSPIVGTGHTFTASGAGTYAVQIVHAFSGAHLTAPFDGVESGNVTWPAAPPFASGSVTPSQDGALVVTGYACLTNPGNTGETVAPAMTTTAVGTGATGRALTGWLVQATAAAINPTWSCAATAGAAVATAVFRSAGSGGVSVYPPGSYPATVLASAPSAYWRLNEASGTVASEIIGGKDGTISGGVTLGQRGALMDGDAAMVFDGVDDQIATAAPVALRTPYTLEVWFKKSGSLIAPLVSTRAGYPTSDVVQLKIQQTNGVPTVVLDYANATSPEQIFTVVVNAADGQWHHVVAVVTPLNVDLYFDGLFKGPSHPLPATFTGATLPVTFAKDQFDGFGASVLDEVAIYPRALPASEILAHYQARLSGLSPYAARVVGDGASAYWRLGETAGTTAVDSINGVNGTISGGVTLAQPGALLDGDKAMGFTGTGQIAIPVGAYSAWGTGPVSMECWFKTGTVTTGYLMDTKVASSSAPGMQLFVDTTPTLRARIGNGTTTALATVALAYADNVWHHVVGVVVRGTTDTLLVYLDGALAVTTVLPATGWNLTATNVGTIGAYSGDVGTTPTHFIGSLDEVAIYPRVLSPAEIAAHYDLGVYGYTKSVGGRDTNSKLQSFLVAGSTDLTTDVVKNLATRTGEMTARMKKLILDAGASN